MGYHLYCIPLFFTFLSKSMKKHSLLFLTILLLQGGKNIAEAQVLDNQFVSPNMFGVGAVNNAVEQPDGKRIVIGQFSRVNGNNVGNLVRLTATGAIDATFRQNLGAVSNAYQVTLLANGQLLVNSAAGEPITAGGITRNGVVRLNADGTADGSFTMGTGIAGLDATYIDNVVPLPSGKFIITGAFDHLNGTAANNIARLNSDGSFDTTFNAGTGTDTEVESIALLPNGQLLIGGYFSQYNGSPGDGVIRLNADGTRDATFVSALSPGDEVVNMVVQPDGRVLVSGFFSNSTARNLLRLLPNGGLDNSFSSPTSFTGFSVYSYYGKAFDVQPDGKILVINNRGVSTGGVGLPRIARLNADGTPDATFQVGTGPNIYPRSLQRLANGQVLVSGTFTNFNGTLDRSLIQLNTNGSIDASFQPLIQAPGATLTVAQQNDGKLLIGGTFTEINGQAIRRVARLNTDGSLDATFLGTLFHDFSVLDVAVQANGSVLSASRSQLQRSLTNGTIDNSFSANLTGSGLTKMLLQPDGRILLSASGAIFLNTNSLNAILARLLPDGSLDNSFMRVAPVNQTLYAVSTMALQPNGKIVVAGYYYRGLGSKSA